LNRSIGKELNFVRVSVCQAVDRSLRRARVRIPLTRAYMDNAGGTVTFKLHNSKVLNEM